MVENFHKISDFPRIHVELLLENSSLKEVDLKYSTEGFSYAANEKIPKDIIAWLAQYSEKKAPLPLTKFQLSHLPPFTLKVLEELKKISFGSRLSYGDLAVKIGKPTAARAVGQACGRNPYPLFIPCHRVVSASHLGGFSLDHRVKLELLAFENK